MNNSLVIVAAVLLVLSLGANTILIVFIMSLIRRHDEQVDKLTNKIMSRDLSEYSLVEARTAAPKANQVKNNPEQAIAEADPESVMRAIASQTGRAEDYQEFGGGEL